MDAFLQGIICGSAIRMMLKAGLLLFFLVHVCQASLIPPVGPPPIQGVQGNDDQVMSLHLLQGGEMTNLKLRYEKIQEKLAPGNRRYNLFWSEFESTSSAPAPLMCPSGTLLIPANEVRPPCLSNMCTLPYIVLADRSCRPRLQPISLLQRSGPVLQRRFVRHGCCYWQREHSHRLWLP